MSPKISLVASSVRPDLWEPFCNSLKSNSIEYEVIFIGPKPPLSKNYTSTLFIYSSVKPAQCYEIGFRAASGELIHWTADDAEYESGLLDNVYECWKKQGNYKAMVALTTIEDLKDCTDWHHLIGGNHSSPVMAPFGFISSRFMNELGGYDRRFICGQSENDLVMRAYEAGGVVNIVQNKVMVEHSRKHKGGRGSCFRAGVGGYYPDDRKVLEGSWILNGAVSKTRLDSFEPFEDKDLREVTQGPKGKW